MNALMEYLPLIAFGVAYFMYDIYVATGVLMVALIVLVAGTWLVRRRVSNMHLVTLVLAVVFGGLTLAVHDPLFIKVKPSVLYVVFALALAASAFIGRKTLVQRALESQITVPALIWRRVTFMATGFFLLMAVLNLAVAFSFSETVWVNFKLFGVTALSLVFMIGVGFYLSPHIQESASDEA